MYNNFFIYWFINFFELKEIFYLNCLFLIIIYKLSVTNFSEKGIIYKIKGLIK